MINFVLEFEYQIITGNAEAFIGIWQVTDRVLVCYREILVPVRRT
jgi:hypothetical protein